MKVLIVDDDEPVRRLLSKVMEGHGFQIVGAENGLEGIAQAVLEQPDVILMDLGMPKMSGRDAIAKLRALPETRSIPILVLTGQGGDAERAEAQGAGADDLLVKSEFQLGSFLEKVRAAADSRTRPPRPAKRATAPTAEALPAVPKTPSLTRAEVEAKIKRVLEIKALPFLATEIVRLTSDSRCDVRQLTETIERDPALTAKVMRLANSAFYTEHGRIQSLSQGVARLGFRGLRDLALATEMVREYGGHGSPDRLRFWMHSLACATLARGIALAAHLDGEQVETAFLCGLLQNIGQTVLGEQFRSVYTRVLTKAAESPVPLHEVEREEFGMDHAEVGEILLRRWGLPESLAAPILHHHRPGSESLSRIPGDARLVAAVQVGATLANATGIGTDGDQTLRTVSRDQITLLGIDRNALLALLNDLDRRILDLIQIVFLHDESAGTAAANLRPWRGLPPETPIGLVRERPTGFDPLEVVINRMGGTVKPARTLAEACLSPSPRAVVARAATTEWAESQLREIESRAGLPRVLVLGEGTLPLRGLRKIRATLRTGPDFVPEIVKFLTR